MHVNQTDEQVFVGDPTPDLGENRYLTHFTSEITYDEDVVGYILFTRYHYRGVQEDSIPMKWLIQPHSYMSQIQDLVIGTESKNITLPLDIAESIDETFGHVYIIDEITCDRTGIKNKAYKKAISIILEYLEDKTDGILIADGRGLARYLSGMKEAPDSFWGFFNVERLSDRYLYAKNLNLNNECRHSEIGFDPL